MSWLPEPEPTPLRLRLGPRSELTLRTPAEPLTENVFLEPIEEPTLTVEPVTPPFDDLEIDEEPAAAPTPAPEPDPLRAAASEELQRAVEQTAERVDRWMAEQRRRLGEGIDAMVAKLKAERQAEVLRLEEWKVAEREAAERELEGEKERFHADLMKELVEFEHQLGERLREQEERLAKWWDEAEQLAKQRFAELGFDRSDTAAN
jgi:hypothetical protein